MVDAQGLCPTCVADQNGRTYVGGAVVEGIPLLNKVFRKFRGRSRGANGSDKGSGSGWGSIYTIALPVVGLALLFDVLRGRSIYRDATSEESESHDELEL
jgi:hypothetical protein